MSGREVGSPVAQDLVGRGVRAERPAHRDDRMLRCSHPMRAAAENFIRVFFLGHPVVLCVGHLHKPFGTIKN